VGGESLQGEEKGGFQGGGCIAGRVILGFVDEKSRYVRWTSNIRRRELGS
jgi:hypothetical protein